MKKVLFPILAIVLALSLGLVPAASVRADPVVITVPGTACPFFAGQTQSQLEADYLPVSGTGSHANFHNDTASTAMMPPSIPVCGGGTLSITASGTWGYGPGVSHGPGGAPGWAVTFRSHEEYDNLGISRVQGVPGNLLGVFLGDGPPSTPAPSPLSVPNGDDMTTPELQQAFIIGASLSGIQIPAGATRLFFGYFDGFEWNNNQGSVEVTVTMICPPAALDHFLGYKVKTTKVCDGGVTELTLKYLGDTTVDIVVTAKDGTVIDSFSDVALDDEFSFGTEGVKLGTTITITVVDVSETTIHTSCSQPIGPGETFSDFEVVEGKSLKGGPLETPAPQFEPKEVTLTDQFATGDFKVEKPDKFYNPVKKNDEEINDPDTHLMSYKIKLVEYLDPPTCAPCKGGLTSLMLQYNGLSSADVVVTGGSVPFEETLDKGDNFTIVGGGKDGKLGASVNIFVNGELQTTIHTSCSQPIGTGQTFGVFTVVAGESKDGESLCPIITVVSQFGTIVVARDKPDRLLVPTAKSLTGPVEPLVETGVDHFLGYKIKAPKDTPEFQVFLVDQFGQLKLYDVKKPTRLFVPVDKDGLVIKNPEAHLICYTIKPAKDQPKHVNVLGIYTNNQFGPLRLNTDKEVELLVPCQKILPD